MAKPSWLYWLVGVLALLFQGFGVFDFAMTMANNEAYLSPYSAEQIAYWRGLPWWRVALWAIGVGTGMIGALTYWARKKVTAPLWLVGPVSLSVSLIHDLIAGGLQVMGGGQLIGGNGALIAITLAFWAYAQRQVKRGVLT